MDSVHIKSVFSTVFITLGVMLVLIVGAVTYFIIADPLNIKPMLFGSSASGLQAQTGATDAGTTVDTSPATNESFTLSDAQKEALRGFGIDPASVPSTVTSVQVACFEEHLGADRVAEIRAGGVPSAFELLKVKACIQ